MGDDDFAAAVARVLQHEGGYVADVADPGGETKYGISKRSYPDLDIAALTEADAIAIYRRDWWDRYGYGRLPPTIAGKMLDVAVNGGPGAACRLLQAACTTLGHACAIDGVLGPQTIAAAAACDAGDLLRELRRHQAQRYLNIARVNPDQQRFLKGWLARAAS